MAPLSHQIGKIANSNNTERKAQPKFPPTKFYGKCIENFAQHIINFIYVPRASAPTPPLPSTAHGSPLMVIHFIWNYAQVVLEGPGDFFFHRLCAIAGDPKSVKIAIYFPPPAW